MLPSGSRSERGGLFYLKSFFKNTLIKEDFCSLSMPHHLTVHEDGIGHVGQLKASALLLAIGAYGRLPHIANEAGGSGFQNMPEKSGMGNSGSRLFRVQARSGHAHKPPVHNRHGGFENRGDRQHVSLNKRLDMHKLRLHEAPLPRARPADPVSFRKKTPPTPIGLPGRNAGMIHLRENGNNAEYLLQAIA